MKRALLLTLLILAVLGGVAYAAQQTLVTTQSGSYTARGSITSNNAKANANFTELYSTTSTNVTNIATNAGDVATLQANEVKLFAFTVTKAGLVGAGAQEVPANQWTTDAVVLGCGISGGAEWAGGTLSAMTLSVGIYSGDADAFVAATDVFTGSGTGPLVAARGAALVDATARPYVASGTQLAVTITPTGDDVPNATAGSTYVWCLYRPMP